MVPAPDKEPAGDAVVTPGGLGPISAVVCNFNGEQYLTECLDALLALGSELDEIVVVDNGSGDGSLVLLERDYPGVRRVALGTNGGPGVARNAGMEAARNRWVLALDNDVVLDGDTLRRLREALERDRAERPDEGAILAQPRSVVYDDPDTVHYDGAGFLYVGLFSLRNFFSPQAQAIGEGTVEVDGFISLCGLLDAERVLGHGGYDPRLFILFEDHDLSLRLRIAGERLLSVEDVRVRHKAGTPGISFRANDYPAQRAYFHSRNRWLVLAKCHGVRSLVLALPGLLIYEGAWFLFTLRAGHGLSYLRGKLAFFRHLGPVLGDRRRVQRGRRVRDVELLQAGPLTLSPQLVAKPFARRVAGGLSWTLAAWWKLVGRLAS